MPSPANTSGLRDNHSRGTVADFLTAKIRDGSKLSVVSAYFTIYAYEALKQALDRIEHMDFLFGEPSFSNRLDPDKTEKKSFLIDVDGLRLANRLQQKRVAKECADWIEHKVDIKTVKQSNLLHGKMYHVDNGGVEEAILGSSNFTVRGLGLGADGNNIELNLIVDSSRDRQELRQWFSELWNDDALAKDVKREVLDYLCKLYANQSPQFVYYLTLFHLFRDYLDGTRDIDEDIRRVALPDTLIWKALFSFQKDGAKAAINKIRNYNGCILADSVGLGKTFTGLAVIKYFELRNERVLVLCPKKLSRNWTIYRLPSSLNPFTDDKFRFDVLHHTDLSRNSGESNGIDLAALNWGAYDLVVIDESHNFRNNKLATQRPGDTEPRRSRYQRFMEDIIASGVRTKVLLLSATPVNNQLADSFPASLSQRQASDLGPLSQRGSGPAVFRRLGLRGRRSPAHVPGHRGRAHGYGGVARPRRAGVVAASGRGSLHLSSLQLVEPHREDRGLRSVKSHHHARKENAICGAARRPVMHHGPAGRTGRARRVVPGRGESETVPDPACRRGSRAGRSDRPHGPGDSEFHQDSPRPRPGA